jgi:hypothetical protein
MMVASSEEMDSLRELILPLSTRISILLLLREDKGSIISACWIRNFIEKKLSEDKDVGLSVNYLSLHLLP